MRVHKFLFANHGASIYATLIIASGLALTFSMPWASRLSELVLRPWRPFPLPFFLMYATISALMSLSIGAVAAPISSGTQTSSALLLILGRVSFGHFLMLPLVAYSRVLFPNSVAPLIGATLYVVLISVMMSLIAALMEVFASRCGKHSGGRRYGFMVLYFGIPLFGLLTNAWFPRACALVSPLQGLASLLSGSTSASQVAIILIIPTIITIGAMATLFRMAQGRIHV